MHIWVLAEARDGQVKRISYELVTAARALDDSADVTAVLVGSGVGPLAGDLAAHGADRVLLVDDVRAAQYSPDGWGNLLARLAREDRPDVILGGATARGRDLTPRIAAGLGVGVASDAVEVGMAAGRLTAVRPIYAGKALARVVVHSDPQIATIRPNSYPPCERPAAGTVVAADAGDYVAGAVVTHLEAAASTRPDVAEADIIVSGGRGMAGPEHFALIEALADTLGAAVGASRAVVDAGWRPHGDQVGQTGKTVSPSLYIACGISGAVQHLAGMKTSKYIVAINKDPEAPIFSVADYGIVGDVFEVVPAVTEAVRALRAANG
ncbi:electron transfer flavoprotein subunit alpha [bacterium]|nr:electron transfer flavoprotein subunit alpha/FixB family protein [Chloroflexi bacterium CFX6]RIL12661.1 MAG: electron transfer flavoprotein subunit alpha [bacterium]